MKHSLVIPSYNGERYIEQAIQSILSQTRPFDEIIVSDDNSSDATLFICDKYADKIKLYCNPEGPSGFVNGWNNAIAKASGDFICILHQDDVLEPPYLQEAEKILFENQDILHFFTSCRYINEYGDITGLSYPDTGKIIRYSGIEYIKAYQNEGIPHIHRCPGVMTHRSIFEKIQYNPAARHIADDDFFYRVAQYTDVIGLLKPLASYRIHNASETGKLQDKQLVERLAKDYKFQVEQWRNSPFLDKEAYEYFVYWQRKYTKRLLMNSLKTFNMDGIIKALSYYNNVF